MSETDSPEVRSRWPGRGARLVAIGVAVACLAVGAVAVVGVSKWWNVRGISSARELALRGVAVRGDDRTSAVVLGAAAVAAHPDKLNRSALEETLLSGRRGVAAPAGAIRAMALNDDGRTALMSIVDQGVTWRSLDSPIQKEVPLKLGLDEEALEASSEEEGRKREAPFVASIPLEGEAGAAALEVSSDGRQAVIGALDGSLGLWQLDDSSRPVRVAKVPGQNSFMVASVALAADGRTVLAGYERGSVLLWDLSSGKQLATLTGHSSWISGVALSDDGRIAVTISRGSGYIWNLADRRSPVRVGAIPRAGADGEGLDLSADGRTAMIGGQLWNLSDPARPKLAKPVAKEADGVSLSSDGQVALTTDGAGSATLWRITDPARPVKVAEVAGVGELDLDYLTMYDVKESPGSAMVSGDGGTVLAVSAEGGALFMDVAGLSGDPLRDACAEIAEDSTAGLVSLRERLGVGSFVEPCDGG